MHIDEIQKLVEELGAAVIVGEDGPKMIAMSYDTYKNMTSRRDHHFVPAITDRPGAEIEHALWHPVTEVLENKMEEIKVRAHGDDQEVIEKLNQDIAILKEEIKKKELGELWFDYIL